ncbi:hypothetical protein [Paraburkholderia susongensis]|uniref:Uncharacterized protein n=1 Tax=Paraburkholderia susongensis TaxID=1515439 RepID=A0A1X7KY82_9BURK|nr:hypothetical protein [Paraburkholderia susongensis]SMG46153.1 hypothetical protein SAMN06265784_104505 [Paraburkholderia susongensis]
MDRILTTLSGSSQATLIDRDLAHIARAMHVSLRGDFGGPILPAVYWRKRLHTLLDTGHLSHAQFCKVDSLLLQLDKLESAPLPEWERYAPAVAAPLRPAQAGLPARSARSV